MSRLRIGFILLLALIVILWLCGVPWFNEWNLKAIIGVEFLGILLVLASDSSGVLK